MRREERLTREREFQAVYQSGGSWANKFVVLRVLANGVESNRYGFVVSKRVGNAVTRNRVKRRLREVVRLMQLKGGWDIVVIARSASATGDYHQLELSLGELFSRAQLLKEAK